MYYKLRALELSQTAQLHCVRVLNYGNASIHIMEVNVMKRVTILMLCNVTYCCYGMLSYIFCTIMKIHCYVTYVTLSYIFL